MREVNLKSRSLILIISIIILGISTVYADPGYVIITTSEINNTSQKLPAFAAHKESLGFDVQIITENDFGGGIGEQAAQNIWQWLQNHYLSDNIKYALLVGDPNPENSDIPMKRTEISRSERGNIVVVQSVTNDSYYANLKDDWIIDQNDSYPLYTGTHPFKWDHEVMTGRIPCYKSDSNEAPYAESIPDLDNILQKTINYELQTIEGTSIEWRKNALLAIDYYNTYNGEDYFAAEETKKNILDIAQWDSYRIYSQNYQDFYPEYNPDATDSSIENVCQTMSANNFGLVIWDSRENPDLDNLCKYIPDDNNPSFTCHTFYKPVDTWNSENLVYSLLKKPNAGAVCSLDAAGPWYSVISSSKEGIAGTTANLIFTYEYTSRLVSGFTAGEALFGLKDRFYLDYNIFGLDFRNIFAFNIYGDPSLRLVNSEGKTIYVDNSATGNNDGSSWEDAYNFLQDAISSSIPGDEIRIAQGIYTPDANSANPSGTNDRKSSFEMKNNVIIKGGYAGITEQDPNEHDTGLYQTILSGEIGDINSINDNSINIISAKSGVCEASTLEDLVIADAYNSLSDESFGALSIVNAYPTLNNCSFEGNYASNYGGAIYSYLGGAAIENCSFKYNTYTGLSGVIGSGYSKINIKNSVFSKNIQISLSGSTNPKPSLYNIDNCTFTDNTYKNFNPGFVLYEKSSTMFMNNCIVYGNTPLVFLICIKDIRYSDIEGGAEGEGNIDMDPLFADPNNDDYHLKSQEGRWNPLTQTWVQDEITSPCIDTGNPDDLVGNEPDPNGGRINMGAYGGTYQASKTH